MASLTLAALFAFVGGVLSWNIFVPEDLKSFTLLAVAAAAAGQYVGSILGEAIEGSGYRIAIILGLLIAFFLSLIGYQFLIQQGSADAVHIVALALLLTLMFFFFSALLSVAGVRIRQ